MRVSILTALAVAAACAEVANAANRTYYVQADEVDWDYVPTDQNLIHCAPLANDEFASVFTHSGNGYIGKACFVTVRAWAQVTHTVAGIGSNRIQIVIHVYFKTYSSRFEAVGDRLGNSNLWLLFVISYSETLDCSKAQVYRKALFRAYTDDTFTTLAPRSDAMGYLGPPLRAEVHPVLNS